MQAIADTVIGRYFTEAFRSEQPAMVARFLRRLLATDADDRDQVKLRFVTTEELHVDNVAAFLKAHLDSLREANVA